MIKKILVIRYRFIGDTVLTIPFLRNLRRAYPQAQIDMLVGPVSGDVLLDCPYIDNLIYFDTTKKHRYENTGEQKRTFFSYIKLPSFTNSRVQLRTLTCLFLASILIFLPTPRVACLDYSSVMYPPMQKMRLLSV